MGFIKAVLAYLTGWLIAQAFYNRVVMAHRRPSHFDAVEGWMQERFELMLSEALQNGTPDHYLFVP